MSKAQKDRPRLGRGLSSLISMAAPPPVMVEVEPDDIAPFPPAHRSVHPAITPPAAVPHEIALEDITPNPHQPRKQFAEAALAELAASLRSTGLIQPIVVRKVEGGYQLIAGERRWRAAKLAGLQKIPAIIREVDG